MFRAGRVLERSRQPNFMIGDRHLTMDERLIQIQDEIRSEFGWSLDKDLYVAKWLVDELVSSASQSRSVVDLNQTWDSIRQELLSHSGSVAIVGAAVEIEEIEGAIKQGCRFIVADGSGEIFSELEDPKEGWDSVIGVVSDGDGGTGLSLSIENRIPMIIHAHGDNQESLRHLIPRVSDLPISITHQTPFSIDGMVNPGGFTDGDRAVCIVVSMGISVSNIVLLGTRSDVVGRFSGTTEPKRKLLKLRWMKRILEELGFSGII